MNANAAYTPELRTTTAPRLASLALAAAITFSVLAGLGHVADRAHDDALWAQAANAQLSCQASMAEVTAKRA